MEKLECIGVLSEATLWVKDKAPLCSQIPFRQIPVKLCWNLVSGVDNLMGGQILSILFNNNKCEYNSTCKKVAASFVAKK